MRIPCFGFLRVVQTGKKEKKEKKYLLCYANFMQRATPLTPASIHELTKLNKKWQNTIEISHFLCLYVWPHMSECSSGRNRFEI